MFPGCIDEIDSQAQVVITDYPDPDLVQNIEYNSSENVDISRKDRVDVQV